MHTTTPADLSTNERKEIRDFLLAHPTGVLATVDEDGMPCASTIYLTVSENLELTFTTKKDTLKYKNIARQNKIMFVTYEATSQSSVQLSGKAIEITGPREQQAAYYDTLGAAENTGEDVVPPIAKIAAGPYVGFTIDVDNIWLSKFGWGNNYQHAMQHATDPHSTGDPA